MASLGFLLPVLLKTCFIWALSQLILRPLFRLFESGIHSPTGALGNMRHRDSSGIWTG